MFNNHTLLGIDVAKAELVIARSDCGGHQVISNCVEGVNTLLESLKDQASVLIEATGTYHQQIALAACAAGHQVFIVDGYRLSQYRRSIGGRAKTDFCDADLLLRYLQHERPQLRPWSPPPEIVTKVSRLLRRRAQLVKQRCAVRLSLKDTPEVCGLEATASLQQAIERIESLIRSALKDTQVGTDAERCKQVPGLGFLSATALAAAFHKGEFSRVDSFVAFIGLDVVARESGTYRGRRRLSKKGDTETRRLLHNAASSAARHGQCKRYYETHLARGLNRTQVLVMIARKLVRIAYSLMKSGAQYQPERAFAL